MAVLSWLKRRARDAEIPSVEMRTLEILSLEEVEAVLEERSQELLGIDAIQAIKLAEAGELPDDIPGNIVGSWVMMAKGAQMVE